MFEKLLFIIMNVHTQLMKFYIYFLEIINFYKSEDLYGC